MNELALFAGAGGGLLASQLLGWRTVCAVEREAYAAAVLAQRQNDGLLDLFPIWSDVCTFDGKPWRGIVDVVSAGIPCQDVSPSGGGKGIENGSKSGVWSYVPAIIRDSGAWLVWLENSSFLNSRGLDRILWDLAEMGFDAEWGVYGASQVGADHERERTWIVAYSDSAQRERDERSERIIKKHTFTSCSNRWEDQPGMERVANGVAYQMDRLKAIGNGQVPQCAAEAFKQLYGRIK